MQIAIDGPAGSGKSSVAKVIAKELNITYIDTGAMYRAAAYISIIDKYSPEELNKEILDKYKIVLNKDKVFINNQEITKEIRSLEVSNLVANVAKLEFIRSYMKEKQVELASLGDVIMDGRDIATSIMKDTPFKFYLTASLEVRAKRRFNDINNETDFETLKKNMDIRDNIDKNREHSPLIKDVNAIEIDTSNMEIEEVIKFIIDHVRSF